MDNDIVDSAEQIELQAAQARLNQAQQNVAKLRQAALDKAAADLAAYKAAEEKKLTDQRAASAEIERKWAEKRQAEEVAKKTAEAAKKAEEDRLTAELNHREEEKRVIAAKAAEIKKVQDAARALEIEQQQLEAALHQTTIIHVEDKPVTLSSPSHPLSFLFGGSRTTEPAQIFTFAPVTMPQVREPALKAKACPDYGTAKELEQILRPALGYVNTQRADALACLWSQGALLSAARTVVEQIKQQPCGHDQAFALLEAMLEAEQ